MHAHTQLLGCVQFSVGPWSKAHQAPLSMELSRQEYWNGLPFHPPGDLPDQGIKPVTVESLALAGRFFITAPPGKPVIYILLFHLFSVSKKGRKKVDEKSNFLFNVHTGKCFVFG